MTTPQRWKITVDYDGAGFCGWQRQADGVVTVQGVIESAIRSFSGEDVTLHVAGRTDAGVHARGQVAHFDLLKKVTAHTVRDAINYYVRPHRVVVTGAEAVSSDFHARYSAQNRSYRYQIFNRPAPPALMAGYYWHVARPLDVGAMQNAANILLGQHDFSTFRAQGCQSNSPIKTLDRLDVARDGDVMTVSTTARSFLYHQVRNMVGTLALVGSGQWSQAQFTEAFAAADRRRGGPTAPPEGLCFWGVGYGNAQDVPSPFGGFVAWL